MLARRFFDDVLAGGSERAVDELIAADAIVCMPTGRFTGPDGVKRASAQITSAYPDRRVEIRTLVALEGSGRRGVDALWHAAGGPPRCAAHGSTRVHIRNECGPRRGRQDRRALDDRRYPGVERLPTRGIPAVDIVHRKERREESRRMITMTTEPLIAAATAAPQPAAPPWRTPVPWWRRRQTRLGSSPGCGRCWRCRNVRSPLISRLFMDDGQVGSLFRATASSTPAPAARSRAASASIPT